MSHELYFMNLVEANREYIDQELFSERALSKLLKFFPNYKSLLLYHAQRMQDTFPSRQAMGVCEFCKQSSDVRASTLNWRGKHYHTGIDSLILIFMVLNHHGHASTPAFIIDFSTHHRLCGACLKTTKWKRTFAAVGENLFFTFLLLTVLLFASGLILMGITLGWKLERLYMYWSLVAIIIALTGIFLFIHCQKKVFGWILPKEFRMIAKQPFKLISID